MNNVSLSGYVVRDPKVFNKETDKRVAKFTLAVKDRAGKTNFINCSAFMNHCDRTEKYAQKGTLVALIGKLNSSMVEQNGLKFYLTEVNVDYIEFQANKKVYDDIETPPEDDYPFK